jgi:hypothetical protein
MWLCEEILAKSRIWFHKETPANCLEGTIMVCGRTSAEIDADAERQMEQLRISHSSLCYEMSQKLVALKQEQLPLFSLILFLADSPQAAVLLSGRIGGNEFRVSGCGPAGLVRRIGIGGRFVNVVIWWRYL